MSVSACRLVMDTYSKLAAVICVPTSSVERYSQTPCSIVEVVGHGPLWLDT